MRKGSLTFQQLSTKVTSSLVGLVVGVLLHLYLLTSEELLLQDLAWQGILICAMLSMAGGLLVYWLNHMLDQLLLWERHTGWRLFTGILVVSTLTCTLFIAFYALTPTAIISSRAELNLTDSFYIKLILLTIILGLVYSIIHFSLYSYLLYSRNQTDLIRQHRRALQLQQAALQSHLSPHFMFNSLNTISSLLHTDRDKAERYIRQMASVYNTTLDYHKKIVVTVQEELDLVQSYLFMMRTRWGDHFTLRIDQALDMSSHVLPLSIQLLVENALKHNIVDDNHRLAIDIRPSAGGIEVTNNITLAPLGSPSSMLVGHSNLRQRYMLHAGQPILIRPSSRSYTVTLPHIN